TNISLSILGGLFNTTLEALLNHQHSRWFSNIQKNMRRTERAAYRTKFYSNLSSPTRFDEEPFLSFLLNNKEN
ncbi:hypothetical protein, partial [Enterococcus avium]|uniref:hypothetical protein n=1 Tax=Enterococcus avium TaxID=33945 RepID=UPI00378BC17D